MGEAALDEALKFDSSLQNHTADSNNDKISFCTGFSTDATTSTSTTTTTTTTAPPSGPLHEEETDPIRINRLLRKREIALVQPGSNRIHDGTIEDLLLELDAVELARKDFGSQGDTVTALLTGSGKIEVFGIAKKQFVIEDGVNETEYNPEDSIVFRKSAASSSSASTSASTAASTYSNDLVKSLLNVDPLSQTLTLGGACRYCVQECPDNL